LGVAKDNLESIKAKVEAMPLAAMAAEAGKCGAWSIRLSGIIGSSLEAIKIFQNTAVEASTKAKVSIKEMADKLSESLDEVAEEHISYEDMKIRLDEMVKLNTECLELVRAFHLETSHVETARSLAFSASFADLDVQGRLVGKSSKALREVWAQAILTDSSSKGSKQFKAPFVEQPYAPNKLFPKGVAKGLQTMVKSHELREKSSAALKKMGLNPSKLINPQRETFRDKSTRETSKSRSYEKGDRYDSRRSDYSSKSSRSSSSASYHKDDYQGGRGQSSRGRGRGRSSGNNHRGGRGRATPRTRSPYKGSRGSRSSH
jgi:hypothetical protein